MSSSSEPPSPTLGRTFLDRLTSVFHEEELNDRADVLEVLGEARRRNVIDDEVFSMMEGAMAVSEIRAGDLMVPASHGAGRRPLGAAAKIWLARPPLPRAAPVCPPSRTIWTTCSASCTPRTCCRCL